MAPAPVVLDDDGLEHLLGVLRADGYVPWGPVVRDGAVVSAELGSADDLPRGWHDEQAPGRYRLHHDDDPARFAWAVGPTGWKARVFPPESRLWRGRVAGGRLEVEETPDDPAPVAAVGVRPCDLAALGVLDAVLGRGARPDPAYQAARAATFLAVVECTRPADTCFCASVGTGPAAGDGADLVLTELADGAGVSYLARAATERGRAVLDRVSHRPARPDEEDRRRRLLAAAAAGQRRRLDGPTVAGRLGRLGLDAVDDVAGRCLACGNCTLVCPTCFCSDVRDTTDLTGWTERRRRWASCFDREHSLLHGGPVRSSTAARYRQWITHKLATWEDQFGTAGCVGCGRCTTWCPAGIDLVAEAGALAGPGGAP